MKPARPRTLMTVGSYETRLIRSVNVRKSCALRLRNVANKSLAEYVPVTFMWNVNISINAVGRIILVVISIGFENVNLSKSKRR